MEIKNEIVKFIENEFSDYTLEGVEELISWNGKRVFAPSFIGDPIIGIHFVFVENDTIRLSTYDEAEEYINFYVDNSKNVD